MPSKAAWIECTLGRAFQNLGNFSKALEHHKEHLTMAKEVGERAGEGEAYANLGIAYDLQGDYAKAIEYHTQRLAIAKEVGDRAGEGRSLISESVDRAAQGYLRSAGQVARGCQRRCRVLYCVLISWRKRIMMMRRIYSYSMIL